MYFLLKKIEVHVHINNIHIYYIQQGLLDKNPQIEKTKIPKWKSNPTLCSIKHEHDKNGLFYFSVKGTVSVTSSQLPYLIHYRTLENFVLSSMN